MCWSVIVACRTDSLAGFRLNISNEIDTFGSTEVMWTATSSGKCIPGTMGPLRISSTEEQLPDTGVARMFTHHWIRDSLLILVAKVHGHCINSQFKTQLGISCCIRPRSQAQSRAPSPQSITILRRRWSNLRSG